MGFFPLVIGYSRANQQDEGKVISSTEAVRYGLFIFALLSLQAALTLLPEGLTITGHEGDLLHMLDASLRMVDGEMPHLDFMTPIGILGFAPVAGFLALGFKIGKATLLANMLIATLLLPAIWWVGASRLRLRQALFFGVVMLVLLTAVVYGGAASTISLSMFYNRWGWAVTLLVLMVVLLPARVDIFERWLAPLLIGTGMAALAMLKMTFFAPLAPAIVLILLAQKRARLAGAALLVGGVIGALLVAWLGPEFFAAYFADLLSVTTENSGRTTAGESFLGVIASPQALSGSLVLLAALLVFRKSGHMEQGLVILILAPVFAYITYQNWGNDPKWLFLIIIYLWVNLPDAAERTLFGLPARQSILALIVVALTVVFPSFITMATSPVRAAFASTEGFMKLPIPDAVADIWLPETRVLNAAVRRKMDGMPELLPEVEPVVVNGFSFPDCRANETVVPMPLAMARQIEALDFARGRPVLTADVLNISWLFGDVGRVKGAAPWYYGDDAGIDNAAFLMVPICAIKPSLRDQMLRQVEAANYELREVYRSNLMVLYRLDQAD